MIFRGCLLVLVCILLKSGVFALYEDQIGKFDWRLQLIGKPSRIAFDKPSDKDAQTKRVYAVTEQNVLAALNWFTGDILWRHVFEQGEAGLVNDLLLTHFGDVITLTGGGQQLMSWERHRGTLRWSAAVSNDYCKTAKMVEYKNGHVAVLSTCSGVLSAFDRSGSQSWSLSLQKQPGGDQVRWLDMVGTGASGELIVLGQDTKSSSAVLLFYSPSTNAAKTVTKDIKCQESRVKLLSNPSRLVWLDGGKLNVQPLGSEPAASHDVISANVPDVTVSNVLRLQTDTNGRLAVTDGDHVWIAITGDQAKELRLIKADGAIVGFVSGQDQAYAAVATLSARGGFSVRFFDTKSGKTMTEMDVVVPSTDVLAAPEQIYPFMHSKGSGIVVVGSDHSLALINQPGKIIWSRQEALASILSVEMLDLPLSEAQANIEEEFSTNGTILTMFTRRVTTQAIQLQRVLLNAVNEIFGLADLLGKSDNLVATLTSGGGRSGERNAVEKSTSAKGQRFERDYFNLHKIIVAVTAAGKIYGLDNVRGSIVWQKHLPDLGPYEKLHHSVMPLYVLRTTAHYPFPARCAVVGRHKTSKKGVVVAFNPITGTDFQVLPLPHSIKQTVILPVTDEHELQGIGIIMDNMKAYVYPATAGAAFSTLLKQKPFVVFLADETGSTKGYHVSSLQKQEDVGKDENFAIFAVAPAWQGGLEAQGKLVMASMKRFSGREEPDVVDTFLWISKGFFVEQVHSQGRVLGDRSVLYKYVNPNLVAAIVESGESGGKNQMNVVLFDAVTGNNIFVAVHRRVTGPYHLVHCENWIVYTYWNEKFRRNEVGVLELYEGKEQADPAKFSSLNPPQPPIVMRQAYVFPQGISALAVTDTEKGITSRHLLIAMPFGGILELSKAFLDPRRVLTPTMEQREEGLYPYIPDLPIVTEQIINYNQSVYNIRGIHTTPSGLESTSLILAYGLDLYFTRVTPSGTFDILKDDFDHWFIGCVLLALFLGSAIAKKLARHRDVKMAWR